jgi:hypothetical protein
VPARAVASPRLHASQHVATGVHRYDVDDHDDHCRRHREHHDYDEGVGIRSSPTKPQLTR